MERIGSQWSEEDEKLTSEYCNAKSEKESLESKRDRENEEHKKAIIEFEEAKKRFSEFSPRWISPFVYWPIYLAIAFGEGLFNYFVFQIFGQEKYETYVMSLAIVLTIPTASHVIGHQIKKEGKTGLDKFWIILSAAVVVALLVCLAILREAFFEAAEYIKIPIKPITITFILIGFNLAIFVVLTFLSYAESRKNPEEYRKAKKAFEEAHESLQKEGGDVERIASELAEAEERFNKAHSRREHTFERYKHKAEEERDIWVSYIRTYRHANMSARKNKALPESLKVEPEILIKIPSVFNKDLDWSCPGEKREEERE